MKISIGVCGVGIVGSAVADFFSSKKYEVVRYDKYKKAYSDTLTKLLNTDMTYLCLPTLFCSKKKEYDKTAIHQICSFLDKNKYKGLVIVKSTVEPLTCDNLCKKYKLKIVHNPEFLSAKTAKKDFINQRHIVVGLTDTIEEKDSALFKSLLHTCWPNVNISFCKSKESEMMKISCNSFYAIKVQAFNELYFICSKIGAKYDIVREMMLTNGWINPMHTKVPGTDGQISYGGMCFPKDTNALYRFMERKSSPHLVLKAAVEERNEMRLD